MLLYFHSQGALEAMIHKMTRDGMLDNMTNRIPYPALTSSTGADSAYLVHILPVKLLFYLPFVVYVLAAVVIVRNLAARRWSMSLISFIIIFKVSAMAFSQSFWRSDVGHLLQTMQFVSSGEEPKQKIPPPFPAEFPEIVQFVISAEEPEQ